MVTILQFRRPDRRVSADDGRDSAKREEGRSAEIVIFPGVRIERSAESQAAPATLGQPSVPAQAD